MRTSPRNPATACLTVAVIAATTTAAAPIDRTTAPAPRPAVTLTLPGTTAAEDAIATQAQDHALQAATTQAAARAADAAAEAAARAEAEAAEARAAERADRLGVTPQLDRWIREALAIMNEEGIPGSYAGIHRNIMRESGGDPNAVNNWDINAQNGTPSIGLLQVIKPTFDAYHVEGTPHDQYDPVANIVAACNYAADRYGSMDNVDSAY